MVRILYEKSKSFSTDFEILLKKRENSDKSIDQKVESIIKDVQKNSDNALVRLTRKFDNYKISKFDQLVVKIKEIEKGYSTISKKTIDALKNSISRVTAYHKKQIPTNKMYKDKEGVILGGIWNPIESVGLYVPGGKAAYPSSLIMNAVPAIVSGVKRIVITVPATEGKLSPLILACAKILGIKEIYKIGGAQAVAALAFGTRKIKKVDKIFGPGNAFVASAKKQVFGKVGIDMIAGPSEILILADKKNNADHIAIDLLSQAEHDDLAQSILITDNERFGLEVIESVKRYLKILKRKEIASKSWKNYGAVIICKTLNSSVNLINKIAPEHLEIAIDSAQSFLGKIKNAGAIFLGRYTPEAVGDYVAGPNHVLPTDRTARFSSGLNVLDFYKRTSVVKCDKKNLKVVGKDAIILAYEEGLQAHALSIECRIGENDFK